ncbi:MAG: undecaprenyl/decaprenyl-phosphate alpha-N-acetylglucosaminyl 1-phosphate transferase [Gammaproteobacteria bacterium]|nr:undecaprenyl/decaprenyl-phosphate alpha-N-acetylglucosaminyl 1-phosphate transferase [Gammaproteobacteria bacterium]
MLYLFAFIVSLVITMVLIPPLIKYASVIGAIDIPDERKVHKTAIARVGGIAMVVGSVVSMVFWLEFDKQVIGLLGGFLILLFFGIWDDRANLNYRIKFFGQLLAVLVVVVVGEVVVSVVPFLDDSLPAWAAIPFTVFALVGITNAINLSDGLDGLAGGTTLLSLCVIALLAYQSDGMNVVLIAMAVCGSIFGFLRYNTYPARLFMGDTGSQFLGFAAGVLAIILTQESNTAVSPVLPLIILGLPILDTMAVMVQRIYEHRSPFSPDKNHIHHKLLAIGLDHYEAVLMIYIVQSVLVVSAYLLKYESDLLLLFSYLMFSFIVLTLFQWSKRFNWKFHEANIKTDPFLKRKVKWLVSSGILTVGPHLLLKLGVTIILLLSVMLPDVDLNQNIAILSSALLAFFIVSFLISKGQVTIFEKAVVYIVCVLSVYLLQNSTIIISEYYEVLNYFFVILAIGFALKIRFSHDSALQLTPLDFLVVSLVIVVPNIPDMGFGNEHIGEMAIKLIVMFYAAEAVLNSVSGKWDLIRAGIISTLVVAMLRGF